MKIKFESKYWTYLIEENSWLEIPHNNPNYKRAIHHHETYHRWKNNIIADVNHATDVVHGRCSYCGRNLRRLIKLAEIYRKMELV